MLHQTGVERLASPRSDPPRPDGTHGAAIIIPGEPILTRVPLFGIQVDSVGLEEAAGRVFRLAKGKRRPCDFVVTPNVDHVLILQEHEGLRRAYADAALVIADGWPVVVAAHLLGRPLPERVPGSDIVPAVFSLTQKKDPLTVFLLGAAPGVAERAARLIQDRWHGVRVVGAYGPPFGFEKDDAENEAILARIEAASPELLLVGLGAPKQETWVHRHRARIAASAVLCIGATIDFLAGEKPRAPPWMRRVGLEWFHRMASEPKRLVPRYAKNAAYFPSIVFKQWKADRGSRES
jgi:N-acetylglucosaminyldiphosphoundecaprenol N-acetyl-beta-D-mannosaminyltransferase